MTGGAGASGPDPSPKRATYDPAMRNWLAVGIAAWTALAWFGRIRLLTAPEQTDPAQWARIGGSILIGLVAAAVLVLVPERGLERWVLTGFAVWSTAIWLRSLVTVWSGDSSLPFQLVHTVLAAGFVALAVLAARIAWSPRL